MKSFFLCIERLVCLVALISFTYSCSKDNGPLALSDLCSITSVTIGKADNPSFSKDGYTLISGNIIYATLPPGAGLSTVIMNISASAGATVAINGVGATNGRITTDLSGLVNIEVTSESGRKSDYILLAHNGYDELDKFVYAFMKRFSIPGISVAFSKQESVLYTKGMGFADVASRTRVEPGTLFRLASVSKQFTTMCIMKLYEAGKLTIEDKVFGVGGVLESEFTSVSQMASRVTVKHLLEHTSGWTSDPDPMFTTSFKGQTLDQRIQYVLGSEQREPGTRCSYFNMGFGILGKVVEKLSGKEFEVYLKEVLAEAGIGDVHIGGDLSQRRANEAVYYSQDGNNGYANEMDVIAAAGGVIASTEEMTKFLFHIDGFTGIPDIIKPETRQLMLTPSTVYDRYALCWRINHQYFPNACFHTGNLAGTAVMWVMGNDMNCIVLCNSRSYISGFDDELYGLLRDLRDAAIVMRL